MVENIEQVDIIIFGAGGHAKVASDCARENYPHQIMVSGNGAEGQWNGVPVLSQERNTFAQWKNTCPRAFVAIGDGKRREAVTTALIEAGFTLTTLIHPSATVSSSAKLGIGTLICPRAVVNAGARVGMGCIINTGAIIEHECVIRDFSHVSPGAVLGGGVELGEHCWICLGASVADHVQIGHWSTVGAGAVVLTSLPEHVLAVGVPAKICRQETR